MEVKTFKTESGCEYTIVNESFSNSRSWGHKSTLLLNGWTAGEHRVTYYNRTWESYQYQTSMKLLLEKLIKQETAQAVEDYKELHGKSRVSKQEREDIAVNVLLKSEYRQIYKQL